MIFTEKKGFWPKTYAQRCLIVFLAFISCQRHGAQEKAVADTPSVFQWEYASPESQGMSSEKLDSMTKTLAEKGTKKLMVIKNDKIVYEWFATGWEDSVKGHYSASLAKALVGGMSILAAEDDRYLSLDEAACNFIPAWKADGQKSKITIRQLATHTSGLTDAEGADEELKVLRAKKLNLHFDLPGWKGQFWRREPDPFTVSRDNTPVNAIPGTTYQYSNPGIAMLTYAVTNSLKDSEFQDIRSYLKKRVYDPIGMSKNDYQIGYGKTYEVEGMGMVPSWGGGNFTARSIARIGLLMLHRGNWMGKQLIDSASVKQVVQYAGTALPFTNADDQMSKSDNFRYERNPIPATTAGWYSNFDGVWRHVPRDAFAGGGAGNQHLFVVQGLNMVIVRMGDDLFDESKGEGFWYGPEQFLLNPIMDAIEEAPYPESDLSVEFAPKESVIRLAQGGDNWPMTWGDDDVLYTAYGDGNGFLPNTDIKLSLGLAKVTGNPPSIEGANLRSNTGEKVGQGKYGVKASGILMVDGVLYMLTRNAQNAGLMWSADHGENWEEADWKFDVSFGCPTFLNYGKNYEGATDNYAYIYSNDEASAYKNSDHFVLARVPGDQVKNWRKYEFFSGFDGNSNPKWTEDIRKREPVFTNPGRCYRSGITYNKALKKYLWCQTIQLSDIGKKVDVRFKGGLGIFESENPWGPWKTVFYTRDWDIGPGETSSIPTKWMSGDGKTCYLLFSGDDYFSIRKIEFKTK
jgi:CubicO group peptidase (beta-lactamase class C family)